MSSAAPGDRASAAAAPSGSAGTAPPGTRLTGIPPGSASCGPVRPGAGDSGSTSSRRCPVRWPSTALGLGATLQDGTSEFVTISSGDSVHYPSAHFLALCRRLLCPPGGSSVLAGMPKAQPQPVSHLPVRGYCTHTCSRWTDFTASACASVQLCTASTRHTPTTCALTALRGTRHSAWQRVFRIEKSVMPPVVVPVLCVAFALPRPPGASINWSHYYMTLFFGVARTNRLCFWIHAKIVSVFGSMPKSFLFLDPCIWPDCMD